MRAVWSCKRLRAKRVSHSRETDDECCQLHCLAVFVDNEERQADVTIPAMGSDMCRGSLSRTVARRFQLESLILAQNERWRQA